MKPCPYCHARTEGLHHKSCKEMRAIERIDVIVAENRHFHHTGSLLRAIFAKQSLQQRKPKKP